MALRSVGWGIFAVLLVLSAGCDWPLSSQPSASLTPTTGAVAAPTALTSTPQGQAGAISSVLPSGTESAGPTAGTRAVRGDINLFHLNFLVEDVTIAGQPMAITHIYSEFPRYEWVDASGEGIAALDDAARAAVVYLTDYERTGDQASLDKARRLLNFAMYLQADDGEFYNFITDRNENVWPMVKTGKGLSEMLLSSEDL